MPEAGPLRSPVASSSPVPTTPLGVLSGPIIPTLLRLALRTTLFQIVALAAILFGVITSGAMLSGAWGRRSTSLPLAQTDLDQ